jgi:hypothetical protein
MQEPVIVCGIIFDLWFLCSQIKRCQNKYEKYKMLQSFCFSMRINRKTKMPLK